MPASSTSPSLCLIRGTLLVCFASALSLTACFEVKDQGVAQQTETTGQDDSTSEGEASSDPGSAPDSSMEDQDSSQSGAGTKPDGSSATSSTEDTTQGSTGSDESSTSGDATTGDATTSTTTTSTTGQTSSTPSSDESSTDMTGDTSSSSDTTTEEPKRDCDKIQWGQGQVVERRTAQGYVDKDADDELETEETAAGMCELHLSGRKCGLVLFGFDG